MKLKKVLLIVCSVFFLQTGLFANTLFPEIYGNLGFTYAKDSLSFKDAKSLNSSSDMIFAIGVRPIVLPIIGGFRGELSYSNNFKKNSNMKLYGTTIYYDFFRFLPINPYIGSGYYRTNSHFDDYDDSNNLVSLNAGLNASLPINMDLFIEYRAMKDSYVSFIKSSSGKVERKDIFLGLRFYFL